MELIIILIVMAVIIIAMVAAFLFLFRFIIKQLKESNDTNQQNYLSWSEQLNKINAYWVDNNKFLVEKLCRLNEEWAEQYVQSNLDWADELQKCSEYYNEEIDSILTYLNDVDEEELSS